MPDAAPQAQPGDPYAQERAERAQRASALFRSDEGVNHYAEAVHRRVCADLYYLSRWRRLGAAEAGRQTCERYGHEPRGRQCVRCGAYTA
jgi:hypothetical protein